MDKSGLLSIFDQASGKRLERLDQQQVEISSRLANTPRYLNLPQGHCVETLDNDLVDRWVRQFRPGLLSGLVHRLESNLSFVLITLLLVVAVVWGTARFGVPAASQAIAQALPPQLLDRASEETLQMLDRHWLSPSGLSEQRQQALQAHFAEAIASHPELRIRVAFRSSDTMGANAFALPDGRIIFTDEIVKLARHDDELLAVLAHEIGHVQHRHSLRRLVQNSLFVFLLSMITGDMSGTAEVVLGLPLVFTELAYSRAYETEADGYARNFMLDRQIPLHRFSDLMLRMESGRTANGGDSQGDQWRRYLSTHPLTEERVEAFQ